MLFLRNLQKIRTFYPLSLSNPLRNDMVVRDNGLKLISSEDGFSVRGGGFYSMRFTNAYHGGKGNTFRGAPAKSMRSKVESRMRKESGKTLREIRRAQKLRKKLMTDEERMIFNLRRAKKKSALLLQKLKKYELPELPTPRHDPELLTPEQMQAYKKIGFRNKNYAQVGVRGVFGGVVQNMHMHWKFHETVQVLCDNFPKEKIKEMASILARLSGGIVVNIHNVKTIIMYRGRNYRQPKSLIPLNTLTKRKALFKSRFEQALESQKLNIKKIEDELRRKGVNPEDPVAMASIQRVASTFFNAIDKKEGSPYVFQEDNQLASNLNNDLQQPQLEDDSDQEELDRFIAEIEDAADKEWEEEEAAEKEELGRLKYWNKEDYGGRYKRSEMGGADESDEEIERRTRSSRNPHDRRIPGGREDFGGRYRLSEMGDAGEEIGRQTRSSRNPHDGHIRGGREDFGGRYTRSKMGDADQEIGKQTRSSRNPHDRRLPIVDSDDEAEADEVEDDEGWDSNDSGNENIDEADSEEFSGASRSEPRIERLQTDSIGRGNNNRGFKREILGNSNKQSNEEHLHSEDMLSDVDNVMFDSDDEEVKNTRGLQSPNYNYQSSTDEEAQDCKERSYENGMGRIHNYHSDSEAAAEDLVSEEPNVQESWKTPRRDERGSQNNRKMKNSKEVDETWDSD